MQQDYNRPEVEYALVNLVEVLCWIKDVLKEAHTQFDSATAMRTI